MSEHVTIAVSSLAFWRSSFTSSNHLPTTLANMYHWFRGFVTSLKGEDRRYQTYSIKLSNMSFLLLSYVICGYLHRAQCDHHILPDDDIFLREEYVTVSEVLDAGEHGDD